MEKELINIRKMDKQTIKIRIVGDTPLITHAWSEKAKRIIVNPKPARTKRDPRNPFDDFINSMYWLTEKPESTQKAFDAAVANGAKWGFPVSAIKKAANSAAYRMNWVKTKTSLKGTYWLNTEYGEFAEIKGSIPEIREDMVKIGQGVADVRYRAEFKHWYMDLALQYCVDGPYNLEQIMNCIDLGGFACGIGEWRTEKDGTYGSFHIETI